MAFKDWKWQNWEIPFALRIADLIAELVTPPKITPNKVILKKIHVKPRVKQKHQSKPKEQKITKIKQVNWLEYGEKQ